MTPTSELRRLSVKSAARRIALEHLKTSAPNVAAGLEIVLKGLIDNGLHAGDLVDLIRSGSFAEAIQEVEEQAKAKLP